MSHRLALAVFTLLAAAVSHGAERPRWIAPAGDRDADRSACLFTRFELEKPVRSARLVGVADFARAAFHVNGHRVAAREPYEDPVDVDTAGRVDEGENTIGVVVHTVDGPSAVFLRLDVEFTDGTRRSIVSGGDWRSLDVPHDALHWPDLESAPSRGVATYGEVARFPWGERQAEANIAPWDDYTQWKRARGDDAATPAATFDLLPGFELERLHVAGEDEGSWIALAFDPRGRLVVSKEERGLLRITLPNDEAAELRVETVDDTLRECRGLVFRDGDLYAMANVDEGLFRLRDTNGDDRFDDVRRLATFEGDSGHGRNQITLGPDGRLYGIFGDSVFEPEDAKALPPALADPTSAERTRSGFLARSDDGTQWEVVARGLRNPFGVAFNAHGEAFTYDADAEYDTGAPWYRPTRIDHLVSGGDFGWRRVTKQWPPYDPDRPDMPRPTLDVGKGSPTAVAFGYGSKFPPAYRHALFALDWAYGRILAVHLEPRGSSYAARAETFLRGRPANVTDVAFGPDGAMYFVTGGRGTQSVLYRVRDAGPDVEADSVSEQARAREAHAARNRERRRALESFHRRQDSEAVATAWPALGDPDPWIRHAARVAIEWQPVETWADRALAERRPWAAAEALLALVRQAPDADTGAIVARIGEFPLQEFTENQRLTLLFVLDRCLGAEPPPELAQAVLKQIDPLYPGDSREWNRRASRLLARLAAPRFVERTLPLLESAKSQRETFHYLFVLRHVREGWSPDARRVYFEHLRRFDDFVGGEGMPTFRKLVQSEALASVPEAERQRYEAMLKTNATVALLNTTDVRTEIVREWTLSDLEGALDQVSAERDFERGRRAFAAAKCLACHRVERRGGVVGPDLGTVSRRFSPRDVLVSILDPSRVVSEKYRQSTFVLEDGRVVTGQVVPGDFRAPELRVATDPLDPTQVVEFPKTAIDVHRESDTSPMPKGLLNVLTKPEILDLLAYLQSAGDPDHPAFRQSDAASDASQ